MAKKIHLVCNAHLDPVWTWQWEDGAAEAVSTYRIAADFCEEEKGFVFNHNEALLYGYVEELDPRLFQRIQRLVREGSWHIAGGSFVQPDVNAPQGESLIRQFLVGLSYFGEKFRQRPTTAYNFDSFGHPAGLPQILAGCGFDSYIFCRPNFGTYELPTGAFRWQDGRGNEVLARRSDDHYLTNDRIKEELDKFLPHYSEEPETIILWGIGNHGGGVSRREYKALQEYIEDHPDHTFLHSTPERFFEALRKHVNAQDFPVVQGEIESCMVGCYTSSSIVKQSHRKIENLMAQTERLAAVAWWIDGLKESRGDGSSAVGIGQNNYPKKELDDAWKDMLFVEFHDILPGSSIKPVEEDAWARLGHAEEILRRIRLGCFASLIGNLPKAEEGGVPIFVFNPHACSVNTVLDISYQLAHMGLTNGSAELDLRISGEKIVFQREKSDGNLGNDWRIKVAVPIELRPMEMLRIDASYEIREKAQPWKAPAVDSQILNFRSSHLAVSIDPETGLADVFADVQSDAGAGGQDPASVSSVLHRGALCPTAFSDLDHSWTSGDPGLTSLSSKVEILSSPGPGWKEPAGKFGLCSAGRAAELSPPPSQKWRMPFEVEPAVRIVEDGPVRRVIEAILVWSDSYVVRHYLLYHNLPYFDIEDRIFWGEKDGMLKIEVPLSFTPKETIAESLFGSVTRQPVERHSDEPCQRWIAAIGDDRYLGVINDGSFAYSLSGRRLYINVLRSPAYSSFNLHVGDDRHEKRFIARQSQGEHRLRFRFLTGRDFDESEVRRQADIFNVPPAWQVYFPGGVDVRGKGRTSGAANTSESEAMLAKSFPTEAFPCTGSFLSVKPDSVRLVAMKRSEDGRGLIVRLLETRGVESPFSLQLLGIPDPIVKTIQPWSLMTLKIIRGKGDVQVVKTNLVEEPMNTR